MKIVIGIVIVAIVALFVGCTTPSEPKPFPPPEGYESWEEYQRQTDSPSPTATLTPDPNPSSIPPTPTETESYEVSFHAFVQSVAISSFGLNKIEPVGLVIVKNTDDIPRTFKVEITHYYGGKGYTKEFTIQLEPGQIKTVIMDSDDVPSSAEVGENYWAGDWGIDYQVIPDNKGKS